MTAKAFVPFAASLLLGLGCASRPAEPPAELVLTGGRIVTLDPARPDALAVLRRAERPAAAAGDDAERLARLEVPQTQGVAAAGDGVPAVGQQHDAQRPGCVALQHADLAGEPLLQRHRQGAGAQSDVGVVVVVACGAQRRQHVGSQVLQLPGGLVAFVLVLVAELVALYDSVRFARRLRA